MRICYVLWEYVNMKGSRSTCTRCVGGPGRLPTPSSCSAGGAVGGGGGEAGKLCPAWGSWAGKGGSLAREFGGSCSRVDLACSHGKTFWRVCLAGPFGKSSWRIYSMGFESKENMLLSRRNRKEWNVLWWICGLQYHYVVSNIVLFAFIAGSPEPANCGLKTVVMWICESDCEWKYTSWRREDIFFLLFCAVSLV